MYLVPNSSISVSGSYTNLRLGDIEEYNCTLPNLAVTVQWNVSDTLLNNPLILTVNQSVNNTKYTCIVTVNNNSSVCEPQRKDVIINVRGNVHVNDDMY